MGSIARGPQVIDGSFAPYSCQETNRRTGNKGKNWFPISNTKSCHKFARPHTQHIRLYPHFACPKAPMRLTSNLRGLGHRCLRRLLLPRTAKDTRTEDTGTGKKCSKLRRLGKGGSGGLTLYSKSRSVSCIRALDPCTCAPTPAFPAPAKEHRATAVILDQ